VGLWKLLAVRSPTLSQVAWNLLTDDTTYSIIARDGDQPTLSKEDVWIAELSITR
jgi:hypothetical protein